MCDINYFLIETDTYFRDIFGHICHDFTIRHYSMLYQFRYYVILFYYVGRYVILLTNRERRRIWISSVRVFTKGMMDMATQPIDNSTNVCRLLFNLLHDKLL